MASMSAKSFVRARMSSPTHGHSSKIGYLKRSGSIFGRLDLAAGQQIVVDRLILLASVPIQSLAERRLAILVGEGWHLGVLVNAKRVVDPAAKVVWIQALFDVLK